MVLLTLINNNETTKQYLNKKIIMIIDSYIFFNEKQKLFVEVNYNGITDNF